jgi:hypothetical protein
MIKQFKKWRNTGKVNPMTVKQIIAEMCNGINEFNKGYQVRFNLKSMRMLVGLQISTAF